MTFSKKLDFNIYSQLKEKWLHWFGHTKWMDKTRILKRALELKCKGKERMGWYRTRKFNQVVENIKKTRKQWQGIEKEKLWKRDESRDFSPFHLYKIHKMLEQEKGGLLIMDKSK
jgi:hypothetical protein